MSKIFYNNSLHLSSGYQLKYKIDDVTGTASSMIQSKPFNLFPRKEILEKADILHLFRFLSEYMSVAFPKQTIDERYGGEEEEDDDQQQEQKNKKKTNIHHNYM